MYGNEDCRYGKCENDMENASDSTCCEVDWCQALAWWAKKELLKEKVKERMDARYGKKLDKVADLIVEVIADMSKGMKEYGKRHGELKDAFNKIYGEEN